MKPARIAFVHASPAALAPLARYYSQAEPDWSITNLLDDGILAFFQRGDGSAVEAALLSLIERAHTLHRAQAVLITCSALRLQGLKRIEAASPVPVVKIDVPMAESAVLQAERIGVLVSFEPTLAPTLELLTEAAAAAGRHVELLPRLCQGALGALFAGDPATHDALLREAAASVRTSGAEAIVLAQVSMAHLREPIATALGVPVLSSLETSHAALRAVLGYR